MNFVVTFVKIRPCGDKGRKGCQLVVQFPSGFLFPVGALKLQHHEKVY